MCFCCIAYCRTAAVTPADSECILRRVIDAQYETNWPLCQLHALFDSLHMPYKHIPFVSTDASGQKYPEKQWKICSQKTYQKTPKHKYFMFLPLSPFCCSHLINGFFFLFSLSFQLWVLDFLFCTNCFMISTLNQPFDSNRCADYWKTISTLLRSVWKELVRRLPQQTDIKEVKRTKKICSTHFRLFITWTLKWKWTQPEPNICSYVIKWLEMSTEFQWNMLLNRIYSN